MTKLKCRLLALMVSAVMVLTFISNSAVVSAYDKTAEVHLASISHIDTAWQWPYVDVAKNVIPNTFLPQIKLMKESPDYKFTISAMQHLAWAEEYYPDMWKDIKALVAAGQIDLVGGQVVEPDTNSISGESDVRQFFYGQKYSQQKFGKKMKVGFLPDCFGFSGQYPQIMKKSDLDYFVTAKLTWNDTNKFPYNIFYWKGIDGTSDLSYITSQNYDHVYENAEVESSMLDAVQKYGINKVYGSFGSGDHGSSSSNHDAYYKEISNNYNKILGQDTNLSTHVINSTPTQYFEEVSQDDLSKVPTWEGEMYLEVHRGTYTSWARQKLENRKSENTAENAEKESTLGNFLGVTANVTENIKEAWWKILINQFHDVQPGSSVPMAYEESFNNYEIAKNQLKTLGDYGLQAVAYRADTKVSQSGAVPVFVFNPLSWTRNDSVDTSVQFSTTPSAIRIYDEKGTEMPSSVVKITGNTAKVRFEAQDVPSLGYKVFSAVPSSNPYSGETGLTVDKANYTMENQYYKLVINPETGNISHLYNKKDNNRDAFNVDAKGDRGEGNELQIYYDKGGSTFPAWDLMREEISPRGGDPYNPTYRLNDAPKSIEVIEQSKDKAVIRITRTFSGSTYQQDITMYPNVERIDVKTNVDWHESNKLLKVSFPLSAVSNKAAYEIAYGSIERSTNRDTSFDGARFEQSGQRWADITNESDKAFGTSILNDSKYGWDVYRYKDNSATRLRLSLLRSAETASSTGYGYNDPGVYSSMDNGNQEFTYSIYPHAGDWSSAKTVHMAQELNYPVTAFQTSAHNGTGALGSSNSFASVDKDNVILSVLKNPDGDSDPNNLIIRLYESENKDGTSATITLPSNIKSAKEVNLLEEDMKESSAISISGNKMTTSFNHYEIRTFKVSLEDPGYGDVTQTTATTDLYNYYNLDGVSTDSKRSDGNINGNGGTYSSELWPEEVSFAGIPFKLGPKADGYKNLITAEGQKIDLPSANSKYIYLLGAAAGSDADNGTFTVNYSDGTTTTKEITFEQWYTLITGWDRHTGSDIKMNVADNIAVDFTHHHLSTADNYVKDSFLYVYKIPVDTSKTLSSIVLPDANGIKIAAISVADSDFLRTANLPDGNETSTIDKEAPTKVVLTAQVEANLTSVNINWSASTDNVGVSFYKIYKGTTADFTPSADNLLGTISGSKLSYKDNLAACGTYYYKVVALDLAGNASTESDVATITGGLDNAFLSTGVTATANASVSAAEGPAAAIDGTDLNNSKWCYNGGTKDASTTNPYWLRVDLGTDYTDWTIKQFKIDHAGAGGELGGQNTKDFQVLWSIDGSTWNTSTEATIVGNTDNVTKIELASEVKARYFKLNITGASTQQANCARIYEFQAYGTYSGTIVKKPKASNAIIIAATKTAGQPLELTTSYTFTPAVADRVEVGSIYAWYGESGDGNYTKIDGATKANFNVSDSDYNSSKYNSLKYSVKPVDSTGTAGDEVFSTPMYTGLNTSADRALKTNTTVTNQISDSEGGAGLVDGDASKTKWCTIAGRPQSATIDMAQYCKISKFVVTHCGAVENYPNTYEYNIFMSDDNSKWNLVKAVTGNTDNINTLTLDTPYNGRYIKLEVTKTNADNTENAIRIYDFQAWGTPNFEYVPASTPIDITEPSTIIATSAAITVTPFVGQAVTGTYDVDSKYASCTRFRWLQSGTIDGEYTAIYNANASTYTPTSDLTGKYLKFEVRVGTGASVLSNPAQVKAAVIDSSVFSKATVTASKANDSHAASMTIDSNTATYWSADGDGNYLTYTLDKVYDLQNINVKTAQSITNGGFSKSDNIYACEIQTSLDGQTFDTVHSISANTGDTITWADSSKHNYAKYVKILVTQANATENGTAYISEVNGGGFETNISVPKVTDVKIPSSAQTHKLLVASYRYSDSNLEYEGATVRQWMVSDTIDGIYTAIPNATTIYYRPDGSVAGKYIKFVVTPVNQSGIKGGMVESSTVLVQKSTPLASNITVIGDTSISSNKLKVSYQYVDYDSDTEGATQLQWQRSDNGSNWDNIVGEISNIIAPSNLSNVLLGMTQIRCKIIPTQSDGVQGAPFYSNPSVLTPNGLNALKNANLIDHSSSNSSGESAEMLVDGNYMTKWCSTDNTKVNNQDPTLKNWATFDMGKEQLLDTFILRNCKSYEPGSPNAASFKIEVSTDKTNWTTVYNITNNTASFSSVTLNQPATARYVRLGVRDSGILRIYELEAWSNVAAATLDLPSEYSTTQGVGDTFEVQYGHSVPASRDFSVSKEDVEISYNPNMFEYIGYSLVEVDNTSGSGINIDNVNGTITVSVSHNVEVQDTVKLVNLRFKVNEVAGLTSSAISISNAVFTSALLGQTINPEKSSAIIVNVLGYGRDALAEEIGRAGSFRDLVKVKVGVKVGDYFQPALNKLLEEIASASAVYTSDASDQSYSDATSRLRAIVKTVKMSVITQSTGDLDGDGIFTIADLEDIETYYTMSTSDLQGEEKLTDVDGDGKVGLTDLIFISQKITD